LIIFYKTLIFFAKAAFFFLFLLYEICNFFFSFVFFFNFTSPFENEASRLLLEMEIDVDIGFNTSNHVNVANAFEKKEIKKISFT